MHHLSWQFVLFRRRFKGHSSKEAVPANNFRPVPRIEPDPLEKPKVYNKNALRRLDFRIKGKSCAVCLLGIKRRIDGLSGTVKVVVMLKKPYGASIIYDSKQINEQKLLDAAKANEPMITLLDLKDEAIAKVPEVFIPPHANISEFNDEANSALLPNK